GRIGGQLGVRVRVRRGERPRPVRARARGQLYAARARVAAVHDDGQAAVHGAARRLDIGPIDVVRGGVEAYPPVREAAVHADLVVLRTVGLDQDLVRQSAEVLPAVLHRQI